MAATHIRLHGIAVDAQNRARKLISDAEGFLLGPEGQVWSLDPGLAAPPRLETCARDGAPQEIGGGEQRQWLLFKMPHGSRYLRILAVADGLRAGAAQSEVRGGCFYLIEQDGRPALCDSRAVNDAADASLQDGHWVGAARTPYLLLSSRSADAEALLDWARRHELPQPAAEAAPLWALSWTPGRRKRLSPLAAASARRSSSLAAA